MCDKCDAGTDCTSTCQPCTRGCLKKASAVQETRHWLNFKRRATYTCRSCFTIVLTSQLDTMKEGSSNHASSQIQISQILKLIGCDEYKNSVQTLPSNKIRRRVELRETGRSTMPVCPEYRMSFGKALRGGHMFST